MSALPLLLILPLTISFVLSLFIVRNFGRHLLDVPNLRSSHSVPTPRGGGIGISAGVIVSAFALLSFDSISPQLIYWLILPSGLIAILGICDDLFNLNVPLRLAAQFFAAGIGIYLMGFQNDISIYGKIIVTGGLILFVVWMTNLYNFMDGINGLAAVEAISVCASMALIYWMQADSVEIVCLLIIISASTCGFLFWNFPNSRLFMGDSGSLFLGAAIGLLAIQSLGKDFLIFFAWVVMLGVFIVDASYTLIYRIVTKQAVHQAHRTHAYQKAAIMFNSHIPITFTVILINLFWLMPFAIAVATGYLHFFIALLAAYAPLVFIAHKFRAGEVEQLN